MKDIPCKKPIFDGRDKNNMQNINTSTPFIDLTYFVQARVRVDDIYFQNAVEINV
jgi:hypothetical protein